MARPAQGHSRGSLTISLKNLSLSMANTSSLPSPAPPLSVELSTGPAGVAVVAGATMGSWFLLKMLLMVAEGTAAGEGGRVSIPEARAQMALPTGCGRLFQKLRLRTKAVCDRPTANILLMVKNCSLTSKIRTKTMVSTLATVTQHSIGSPSYGS